jgi:hypothetical protein
MLCSALDNLALNRALYGRRQRATTAAELACALHVLASRAGAAALVLAWMEVRP